MTGATVSKKSVKTDYFRRNMRDDVRFHISCIRLNQTSGVVVTDGKTFYIEMDECALMGR